MTDIKRSEKQAMLERRAFLGSAFKAIGVVGAGTFFEQRAMASAHAFEPGEDNDGEGVLFAKPYMRMLRKLTDIVMPATDIPGGVELGVHLFLDHQLFTCYAEADQKKAQMLLLRLNEQSSLLFRKVFLDLSVEQSEDLLHRLEACGGGFTEADKDAFTFTKVLIAFGYFTSKRGATEVLTYQAIPGAFVGSIPYLSVGSAWGSVEFY